MVNILSSKAKDGSDVQFNQLDLTNPELVAVRLGYSLTELRERFPSLFTSAEREREGKGRTVPSHQNH